jgi:MoaE-MoaD fusion protein
LTISVRLFAMLRERAGWRLQSFDVAAGTTVDQAWQVVAGTAPALAAYRSVVRFARNGQYADPADVLNEGDELALIPPVAGGAEALRRVELSESPLTDDLVADLRREVPTTADGAVVIFIGQTRETPGTPAPGEEAEAARFAGQTVTGLEYEAFDQMALAILHDIAAEIEARFGVDRLAIIHRTGEVGPGEASVVIAVATAHRGAAFDACRYAIEELKARAPIWKREQFADGSVWIGAPARTSAAAEGVSKEEGS